MTRQQTSDGIGCARTVGGPIIVRPSGPGLTLDQLHSALSAISTDGSAVQVVIDLSRIDELVGLWTVHFATLIHLSRRVSLSVVGLHGQPLYVAMLYRDNADVQRIVGSRVLAAGYQQAA